MKIGIFGGAFDPVHKEHVNICVWAKRQFDLDKVIVIPSGVSPHKSSDGLTADAHHGLEMAKIAFSAHEGVTVSDYEIKKPGPSYTYLTLRHFRQLYPNDKLFFIMGAQLRRFLLEPGAILLNALSCVEGLIYLMLPEVGKVWKGRLCSYRGKRFLHRHQGIFRVRRRRERVSDEGSRYIKRHNSIKLQVLH